MKLLRRIVFLLVAAVLGALALPAAAQDPAWPVKPVKIVVPFPPGGAIDAMIRALAPSLSQSLGQAVVIENKPGAGGVLGTEAALRANDGHTLLMTAMGHTIYPELYADLKFDPIADFKPIAPVGVVPNVVVVPENSPFNTLEDLITYARRHPGELTYGSAGHGTSLHLTAALFMQQAGIDVQHIPYKGSAPAVTDLVAGRIDMMFDSSTSAGPFIAAKKLKALAVAATDPSPLLPGVKTIAQSGVPEYRMTWWYGLLAPKSTDDAAVDRVSKAVSAALNSPEVIERFAALGVEPLKMTRQAFGAMVAHDRQAWKERIPALGIKPN
ncbi:tripartite tricarboxylate transporter substrate binding protein [Bordetella petrii]|nr:tripartite tricarboxylate transporter substrate binding protein [Bordetella petrii]